MAKIVVGADGSVFKAAGGRRIVGALAFVGTFLLAYLLSPGLRLDLDDVAALLSGVYVIGVKDFVLSFGVFSPVVYFLAMVAQVLLAPIPSAPVGRYLRRKETILTPTTMVCKSPKAN